MSCLGLGGSKNPPPRLIDLRQDFRVTHFTRAYDAETRRLVVVGLVELTSLSLTIQLPIKRRIARVADGGMRRRCGQDRLCERATAACNRVAAARRTNDSERSCRDQPGQLDG